MRTLATCAVLSVVACAQPFLSATISPNPAPMNAMITLTLQGSVNCQSLSACGLNAVVQGNPNGSLSFFCTLPLTTAPQFGPNSAQSWTWNSQGTPPGVYYMRVTWRDIPTLTVQPPWFFPFRIDGPATTDPVLTTAGPPTRGAFMPVTVTAPLYPGAYYIMAASFTSNVGYSLGAGGHIAVDLNDPLFGLSFPNPNPILFPGFQGFLDPTGTSAGAGVFIPNLAILDGMPLCIHAAIIASSGVTYLTNAQTHSIQ